jgi:hypothetical protein
MSPRAHDDLIEYALGSLPEARRRELEAEIGHSRELQQELAALREAFGRLDDHLPAVEPRPDARAALLEALDSADRFSPFVADLMRHFDLPETRVRSLLHRMDDPAAWKDGPMPGIHLIDFPSGPGAIATHAGFTTLPRGLQFPYHRHLGPEINYILEGSMLGDDGQLYIPGEALILPQGSAHTFSIPDSDTLVAVIHVGFEFVDGRG